ncbi:SpoIIE family protein phosphatase [Streptomyces collinus]|uniref:ATPase n=1 Tax=Streptomyces collinus (strain DSM 40733 / Tue 365) TaxID=1214242 RepID=S5VMM4_STRC3|nr:SpoIIE family protein phosphatase [Streptomyces collinus]AGS71787.1 ATPase [Streptomyces collinus Tu 365]UJA10435.1 GAF domain-containing protein [Streptomyces collinus]UJA14701.1 GAF domain-containing protein [Streptomyces collinus]
MERQSTYTATATIDEQGILTSWSEGARRLLGYESSAVVGRPAAALLAAEGAAARRALAGRDRWNGTVPLRHRDGHRLEQGLLAHRRTSSDTGTTDWLLVSAVGDRPQPPRGEPLEEWTFIQSPFPLAIFDTELRLMRANRRLERALSLPEAAMRGLHLSHIAPGRASDDADRTMREVVESGEPRELRTGVGAGLGPPTVLTPLKDGTGRVRAVCLAAQRRAADPAAGPDDGDAGTAGTRAGTSPDLRHTAQELADATVPRLADFMAVDLLDAPRGRAEPGDSTASPLVLRRAAVRAVPDGDGPAPGARVGEATAYEPGSPPADCLISGQSVLYATSDPVVSGWAAVDPAAAWLHAYDAHSLMVVPVRAEGSTLGVALFGRHRRREPFGPEDLRLAEELTAKAATGMRTGRGAARARTTTMSLQRSLLPHTLPDQAALEIATRYLPAATRAGVGGDWFDVIPLSGARVALVVGDVVGHGIRASATMGRLRTAVRTLADVDLPADELLTHLDDLVLRLAADEGSADPAAETAGGIGTTCLYAVYDPVSRHCTLARAGHPPPAVVTPDGTVRFLDVPAGPPLGLGGLPFEAFETELPEGSLLALYTDGLLEARDHDIDEALDKMFAALVRPAPNLDSVCDRVLTELLSHRPEDDIALLVARTRALHADRVAAWELESEFTVVARARKYTSDQLGAWGLEEAAFTTELMVSELVTNAIRYGRPPIQLRLIHQDSKLICEVYDSSGTTPHMRRARIFDEGGRGLLLVAQLAERWGTRHDRVGKTVWAEQSLPGR